MILYFPTIYRNLFYFLFIYIMLSDIYLSVFGDVGNDPCWWGRSCICKDFLVLGEFGSMFSFDPDELDGCPITLP